MYNNLNFIAKITNFSFKPGITSFVNPYSFTRLEKNPSIKAKVDNWHVDGIVLVRLLNRLYRKDVKRFSFDHSSIAPLVFERIKKDKLTFALIGSTQKCVECTVGNIKNRFDINASYFRNGYFADDAEKVLTLQAIMDKKIDVVICGMGTPHQENFLIDLKELGWRGFGYTCGGFIHQAARDIEYYPHFFNHFNIRWLYRIIDEPKLFKRYAFYYPKFLIKFLFGYLYHCRKYDTDVESLEPDTSQTHP